MRNAIFTALAALSLASLASARPPQAPALRPDQAPPMRETVCPCSLTGVCDCTTTSECPGRCVSGVEYRWIETSKPNQLALYLGRKQVGNWWIAEGEYRRLDGDTFVRAPCPVDPPSPATKARAHDRASTIAAPVYAPRPLMLAPYSGGACSGGG